MNTFVADLHIHTVLSPCGSLDMSPVSIVSEAKAKGIDIIGITDHNSTRQCEEVFKVAQKAGVAVILGAEVTTKEEVHCLTFFEDFEKLAAFQNYLDTHLPHIKNEPDKFGHQVWVNEAEEIMGEEDRLLISGINQSIDEVERMVHSLDGLFILAHADRPRFSLYSQLGFMPFDLQVDGVELSPRVQADEFVSAHSELKGLGIISSSDAHYPEQIGTNPMRLMLEEPSFTELKKALKGEGKRTIIPGRK